MAVLRPVFERFYAVAKNILAPGLRSSQFTYKHVLQSSIHQEANWLDLGCGHQVFPKWMPTADQDQLEISSRCKVLIGIDYDLRSLQQHRGLNHKIRGNIEHLPFRNQSFDLVTSNMVLEHVRDPSALLSEVHRILRPGGLFLFHTPNALGYTTLIARLLPDFVKLKLVPFLQDRPAEDVFPTYYRFNSIRKINALAHRVGFTVFELRMVESSAQTVMLGPLVIPELLLIRLLRFEMFRNLRTNVIGVLKREA